MYDVLFGIVLLLTGIFVMRHGLKKALWHRLQALLLKATKTPFRAIVLGTVSAALLQSSTTVCLLTIGLVGSEYITFQQALGIILGANIGTCSTVQLVNLTFPLELLMAFLLLCLLLSVYRRIRYFCLAAVGLISLLAGIIFLTGGIAALSELDTVCRYLSVAQTNPFYAICGGIGLTLAFQSSSAATAFIMLLMNNGPISITTAAYIIYGNNIGSCVSSVVFSAAAPTAARRVALSHILLNVIGAVSFLPLTGLLVMIASSITADLGSQVAVIHLLFNVLSSIIALLVLNPFIRLICFLIPGR